MENAAGLKSASLGGSNPSAPTKTCNKCTKELPVSSFTISKDCKDGYYSYCKVCKRERDKERYRSTYKLRATSYQRSRRQNHKALVDEIKRSSGCFFCSESEPICLEFHHKDPSVKEFAVGNAKSRNQEIVLAEIGKCVCVCSNCHKKIHAGLLKLDT